MDYLVNALLWFALISIGVMSGVYFTFSAFLMRALDALEKPMGMTAMQSINRVILRSTFLPLFFASSLACVALALLAIFMSNAEALPMLVGSTIYVVGMFFVTVAGNVPLNNALEATPADGPNAETMWQRYMQRWVAWNHVRTASCIVAMILLVMALGTRG